MSLNSSIGKIILTAGAVAAFVVAALPSGAQAGEVGNRARVQQARINQGVRNGSLTYREYAHDESHLARINAQRRFDLYKNGGSLTPAERARLNGELNVNSGRIYYTKHNAFNQ
jgi:hypothetical protein